MIGDEREIMVGRDPAPDWRPIAAIPDDRMDGRDVLLWARHMLVGSWCDGWCDAVGRPISGVTHWADAQGPGGETCPAL